MTFTEQTRDFTLPKRELKEKSTGKDKGQNKQEWKKNLYYLKKDTVAIKESKKVSN